MDINGASAIVTGGASGIGAATARLLAAKGAKVVVADLQADIVHCHDWQSALLPILLREAERATRAPEPWSCPARLGPFFGAGGGSSGDGAKEIAAKYGNVATTSVGAIQRRLLVLATVPFALVGGVLSLVLTDTHFSISAAVLSPSTFSQ